MKSKIFILFSLSSLACAARERRTTPTNGCHADNCLRAVRATSQLPQASVDCSRFLLQTITPPPVTVTITSTVTAGPNKRSPYATDSIPPYASACTDDAQFSSACSCIGVTPSTTTLNPSSTTVVVTVTEVPCAGQTCLDGFVPSCDPENDDCFCFTNSDGDGFCGENDACINLTACDDDFDCAAKDSSGDTCAFNTCCGDDGICLQGVCSNPSARLKRMAEGMARAHFQAGTAAFRGE